MNALSHRYTTFSATIGSVVAAALLAAVTTAATAAPPHKKARPAHQAIPTAPTRYPAHGVPRGAFLRKPVHSVAELVQQIKTDRIVASRFSRLFNMSPQMVRLAFGNLHVAHLDHEIIRKVYYVHPGEVIGYRVLRIKKGTAVFAYPDGTPVLLMACANALRPTTLKPTAVAGRPKPPYFSTTETEIAPSRQLGQYYAPRTEVPEVPVAPRAVPPPPDFVVENVRPQPVPEIREHRTVVEERRESNAGLVAWLAGGILIGSLLNHGGGGAHVEVNVVNSANNSNANNANNSNTNNNSNNSSNTNNNQSSSSSNSSATSQSNSSATSESNSEANSSSHSNSNGNSVVPENNGLLLFVFAGAGCMAFTMAKRRYAR